MEDNPEAALGFLNDAFNDAKKNRKESKMGRIYLLKGIALLMRREIPAGFTNLKLSLDQGKERRPKFGEFFLFDI